MFLIFFALFSFAFPKDYLLQKIAGSDSLLLLIDAVTLSAAYVSFLISQKLCKMKHNDIRQMIHVHIHLSPQTAKPCFQSSK